MMADIDKKGNVQHKKNDYLWVKNKIKLDNIYFERINSKAILPVSYNTKKRQ